MTGAQIDIDKRAPVINKGICPCGVWGEVEQHEEEALSENHNRPARMIVTLPSKYPMRAVSLIIDLTIFAPA
jgi:hypothetical protein